MLNSQSRIVLTNLKSMGLGQQLIRIIQYDNERLTYQNELDFAQIMEGYITL
jgi:hypothetical protein